MSGRAKSCPRTPAWAKDLMKGGIVLKPSEIAKVARQRRLLKKVDDDRRYREIARLTLTEAGGRK